MTDVAGDRRHRAGAVEQEPDVGALLVTGRRHGAGAAASRRARRGICGGALDVGVPRRGQRGGAVDGPDEGAGDGAGGVRPVLEAGRHRDRGGGIVRRRARTTGRGRASRRPGRPSAAAAMSVGAVVQRRQCRDEQVAYASIGGKSRRRCGRRRVAWSRDRGRISPATIAASAADAAVAWRSAWVTAASAEAASAGRCRIAGEGRADRRGTPERGVAERRRRGEVPRARRCGALDRRADGVASGSQRVQLAGQLLGERLGRPPAVVEPRLGRQHERLRLDADPAVAVGVAGGEADHDAERAVEPHRRRRGRSPSEPRRPTAAAAASATPPPPRPAPAPSPSSHPSSALSCRVRVISDSESM